MKLHLDNLRAFTLFLFMSISTVGFCGSSSDSSSSDSDSDSDGEPDSPRVVNKPSPSSSPAIPQLALSKRSRTASLGPSPLSARSPSSLRISRVPIGSSSSSSSSGGNTDRAVDLSSYPVEVNSKSMTSLSARAVSHSSASDVRLLSPRQTVSGGRVASIALPVQEKTYCLRPSSSGSDKDGLTTPRVRLIQEKAPAMPKAHPAKESAENAKIMLEQIKGVTDIDRVRHILIQSLHSLGRARIDGHHEAGEILRLIYIKLGLIYLPDEELPKTLPESDKERQELLPQLISALKEFKLADRERSYTGTKLYARTASYIGQILLDICQADYLALLHRMQVLEGQRFLKGCGIIPSGVMDLQDQESKEALWRKEFETYSAKYNEAREFLMIAANRNDTEAQYRLGMLPEEPIAEPTILERVLPVDSFRQTDLLTLHKLARLDHVGAQLLLSLYYTENSKYVIYGYEWFKRAETTLGKYGILLAAPVIMPAKVQMAKTIFEEATRIQTDQCISSANIVSLTTAHNLGHVSSSFALFYHYMNKQAFAEAKQILFELIKAFDDPKAHCLLASRLFDEGNEQNTLSALEHLEVASQSGIPLAFHILGQFVVHLSEDGKFEAAYDQLDRLATALNQTKVHFPFTVKWLRRAAMSGHKLATNYLANALNQYGGISYEATYWWDICSEKAVDEDGMPGLLCHQSLPEVQADLVRRISEEFSEYMTQLGGKHHQRVLLMLSYAGHIGHFEAFLNLARYFQAKGDQKKAISYCEASIDTSDHSESLCLLATMLEDSNPQRSAELYELALQREEILGFFDYSFFLVAQEKYEDARNLYERLLEHLKDGTKSLYSLMPEEARKEPRTSNKGKWYAPLIEFSSSNSEFSDHRNLAERVLQLRRYVNLAQDENEKEKKDIETLKMYVGMSLNILNHLVRQTYYNLGILNEKLGHMHTAFTYHGIAAELSEPNAQYRYALFLQGQEQYEKANKIFELGAKQNHIGCTIQVALHAEAVGRRGPAEMAYRQVLNSDPKNFIALINLALLLIESSPEEAKTFLKRGVAQQIPLAASHLAGVKLQEGDVREAIALYELAYDGFGDSEAEGRASAGYHLARIYESQGKYYESNRWDRRAADRGFPQAQWSMGKKMASLGEEKLALHWLAKAHKAKYPPAARDLGMLLLSSKEREVKQRGVELLQQIPEELKEKDQEVLYALGCALFEPAVNTHTIPSAIDYLRKALALGEKLAATKLIAIAELYQRSGENQKDLYLFRFLNERPSEAALELYTFVDRFIDHTDQALKDKVSAKLKEMSDKEE